jgi:integrase
VRFQYQNGCLRLVDRKTGPRVWEFSWWETSADGKRIRRKVVVGPITKYRTKQAAASAINGLRAEINEECFRRRLREVTVSDVIDHFFKTMLFNPVENYSASTMSVMPDVIERWIRPQWGFLNIRVVRARAVQYWLRNLRREDGQPLANSTKAHVKRVMRRLFNHAIYCEWLEQGKNVIKLVRQSAQRCKEPEPLEPEEAQSLLDGLRSPYREMVIVLLAFGLRCSELFALKWGDFDFVKNQLTIQRSIVYGELGICKTTASRATLPMTRQVAFALLVWKKFTPYPNNHDWVFPSIRQKGRIPMDHGSPMSDVIQPAAKKAGITKRVHWHGFKYTYATWLVASGADIGVVHRLTRHASARTTINFYVKASSKLSQMIQERITRLMFPGLSEKDLTLDDPDVPREVREKQKREAQESLTSLLFGIDKVDQADAADDAPIGDNDNHVM